MPDVRSNKGIKLTTSTATVLYTVPSTYRGEVSVIAVVNTSLSAATITLDWTDNSNSDTVYTLMKEKSIPGKGNMYLELDLTLMEADTLRGTANMANVFEITLNLQEEYFQR